MDLNRVNKIDDFVKVKNILVSVADKTNIESFIKNLLKINPEINIFSTGGTYTKINSFLDEKEKKNLKKVSEYTGQPEMQGGLVKTLDFKIYLGLLSETYNDFHKEDLKRTSAVEIDMVVCNLYPFEETIKKEGINIEDARSNIDIGGPCMLRASAKNFLRVASVCDPKDYDKIIKELENNDGAISFDYRLKLSRKTFNHTANYDKAISEYLLTATAEGVYNAE
ncbi:MAG: hypothetical protein PQJ46_02380 [Spirochaetales bacterium]|nr:hypothetical protein [Spirochaetales bacterium]